MSSSSRDTGAFHPELLGAEAAIRFRAERIPASALAARLHAVFEADDQVYGPYPVVDVSSTGMAVAIEGLFLPPGTPVANLELQCESVGLWSGSGTVVYQSHDRLGLRFSSGTINLRSLKLLATLEQNFERRLNDIDTARETLPVESRAAVADLRQTIHGAKTFLESIEQRLRDEPPSPYHTDLEAMIRSVYDKWAPRFHHQVGALHEGSKRLTIEQRTQLREYAKEILADLFLDCPMHSRAYSKPRGYAGDYHLMTLYFAPLAGPHLFGKFLHHVSKSYTLGRTVVAREALLRSELKKLTAHGRPLRIVSLASGAAMELQRLIATLPAHTAPIELILVDQDDESLAYAYEAISHELGARQDVALPVTLKCLHFSVRQLLRQRNDAERAVVADLGRGVDLIYSAGLFDYLPDEVAGRLLESLRALLVPGGRLLIGNLQDTPDTSWIMENLLAWYLVYRDPDDMLRLGQAVAQKGDRVGVIADETGRCLFIDLHAAS